MSAHGLNITGVVEEMLDHATHGRWQALDDVLDEEFVIVEPQSLPYGGTHYGVGGYVTLMQQIGALFELAFERQPLYPLDGSTVLVRMQVTFTARSTGRSVSLPVLELLEVAAGRVRRSEVFLADTAALLDTLVTA